MPAYWTRRWSSTDRRWAIPTSTITSDAHSSWVGGANGKLDGGLHLRAAPGTPMANVMLTLMHKLGFDDMESFGDSTGPFSLSV